MSMSWTARVFDNITDCMGGTPLVKLRRVTDGCVATVLAKMENMDPSRNDRRRDLARYRRSD